MGGYQERRSQLTQGDGSPGMDVVLPTGSNRRRPTTAHGHNQVTERQEAHRPPMAGPR